MLDVTITAVTFLDRLGQTRVGAAVKDVTDALRMILAQDIHDLLIELIDAGSGAALALYRARTIKRFRHPGQPRS